MHAICKGKNCEAIDGVGHSEDCIREQEETENPEKAIIKRAIKRYCAEEGDPRACCMMIVNAADMLEWLLEYDGTKYADDTPEIFPGTRDALEKLSV